MVITRNVELRFVGKEIWIEWVGAHYRGQGKLIKLPAAAKDELRKALSEVAKAGSAVEKVKPVKAGGVTLSYTGLDGQALRFKPFFGKGIVVIPEDITGLIADLDNPKPELEYGHHAYHAAQH